MYDTSMFIQQNVNTFQAIVYFWGVHHISSKFINLQVQLT